MVMHYRFSAPAALSVMVFAAGGLVEGTASAGETFTWTGEGDTDYFEDEGNWSPAGWPETSDDAAVFDLSGSHMIPFANGLSNDRLTVHTGHVLLDAYDDDVDFPLIYTLTNDGEDASGDQVSLTVGDVAGDDGWLSLRRGGYLAHTARVGHESGSFGRLFVTEGATFTPSYRLHVGVENNSLGQVYAYDESSIINVGDGITVGDAGEGSISISDGGELRTGFNLSFPDMDIVGDSTSGVGEITVEDADSAYRARGSLTLGYRGRGTLNVRDGAEALTSFATLGEWGGAVGEVNVEGAGSRWVAGFFDSEWDEVSTYRNVAVGGLGRGDLNITDGGFVRTARSFIARGNDGGAVTVSGTDGSGEASRWITDGIEMGNALLNTTPTAEMTIDEGGQVISQAESYVGYSSTGTGHVTVDGTGSIWAIGELDSSGEVSSYDILNVGYEGTGTLTLTNAGRVYASSMRIGAEAGADGAVTVQGTDLMGQFSLLAVESHLTMGRSEGTEAELNILDGGQVVSDIAQIAFDADSVAEVTVGGSRGSALPSMWQNAGPMFVGLRGEGHLSIEDGAIVRTEQAYVGDLLPAAQGTVHIGGRNNQDESAHWRIDDELHVGRHGSGQVTVEDHGLLTSGEAYIGTLSTGQGELTIRDAGSTWTIAEMDGSSVQAYESLNVGYEGEGSLTIEDGGRVLTRAARVGSEDWAEGDVTIRGTGEGKSSRLMLELNLLLGGGVGSTGTVLLEDGGHLSSTTGQIGFHGSGEGDVTVRGVDDETGLRSSWVNDGMMYAGHRGRGSLTIEDGGHVLTTEGADIARFFPTTEGEVTVRGSGGGEASHWEIRDQLSVGRMGSAVMTIEEGGRVSSGDLSLVGEHESSEGEVVVRGPGSEWLVADLDSSGQPATHHQLIVGGWEGSGSLLVEDGGSVESAAGNVSFGEESTGQVIVRGTDGAGNPSQWLNADDRLDVGGLGEGELRVEDGGLVTSRERSHIAPIGTGSVTITGVSDEGLASTWRNDGDLVVGLQFHSDGRSGDGELTVADGGRLMSGEATLANGWQTGATASLSGAGTTWTIGEHDAQGELIERDDLYVAYGEESQATLLIEDGAEVYSAGSIIGYDDDSFGQVTVRGQDASWHSDWVIYVGDDGEGVLRVEDGGYVHAMEAVVGGSSPDGSGEGSGSAVITGEGSKLELIYYDEAGEFFSYGGLNVGPREQHSSMLVDDGAQVLAEFLGVGTMGNGQVTVRGEDSQVRLAADVAVGDGGRGELHVESGGQVISEAGAIGAAAIGTDEYGLVRVSGEGARWTVNDWLGVGGREFAPDGDGTLTIEPGGTVWVGDEFTLAETGTLNMYGGKLRLASADVHDDADINFLAGMIQFAGDRNVNIDPDVLEFFAPSLELHSHRSLGVEGTATLLGTSFLSAGSTLSVGSLNHAEYLVWDGGTLRFTEHKQVGMGSLGSTINLEGGQILETAAGGEIASFALINVEDGASFGGGELLNEGQIHLHGQTARLTGDAVGNAGLIEGQGQINAHLINAAEGAVNVGQDQRLTLTEEHNLNAGHLNVQGGRMDVMGELINTGQGQINVTDGLLHVHGALENLLDGPMLGGTAMPPEPVDPNAAAIHLDGDVDLHVQQGLHNEAHMAITSGTARLFANVDNDGGQINLLDHAEARFFGNLINNGDVHISETSRAVFTGKLSGDGQFTGEGTAELAGTLSPGNSPGSLSFGGDLVLDGAHVMMELAGTTLGEAYDHVAVAGLLDVDATLEVVTLDAFTPVLGDVFDLFDFAELSGAFEAIDLPELTGSLSWDTSQLHETGQLSVIPEPGSLALLGAGTTLLMLRRRRAPRM